MTFRPGVDFFPVGGQPSLVPRRLFLATTFFSSSGSEATLPGSEPIFFSNCQLLLPARRRLFLANYSCSSVTFPSSVVISPSSVAILPGSASTFVDSPPTFHVLSPTFFSASLRQPLAAIFFQIPSDFYWPAHRPTFLVRRRIFLARHDFSSRHRLFPAYRRFFLAQRRLFSTRWRFFPCRR